MTGTDPHIREATEEDLDALTVLAVQVQTLHAEGRPDLFRPADPDAPRTFLAAQLPAERVLLLAEVPGGPALGDVLAELSARPASPFQHPHTTLYVHHLAIDGTARRRGVGSALLDAVEQRARAAGADSVRLDSWAVNEGAHALFAARGFGSTRQVFERML